MTHFYTMELHSIESHSMKSFLSIQLINELSQPFHSTYTLSPIFLITFSILNFCCFVFSSSFSWNVPMISSPLIWLNTYVHRTVFLTFLITKTSSGQFGVYPLAKMFLCFQILTWPPTVNLRSLSLTSLLESIYVLS